jgi:hypothetical protein
MTIQIGPGITIDSGIALGDYPLQAYRSPHTITPYSNAKVQTSFVKFGTGGFVCAPGGFLGVTPITDFAFGTSNFTIEFWFYQLNISDGSPFGTRPLGVTSGPYLTLLAYSTGALGLYINGAYRITSAPGSLTVNAWTAVAIVRYNGTTKMYLNGTSVDAGWADSTNYQAGSCIIGALDRLQNNTFFIRGYMDELRVSNVARYTSDYTPATQPFVNDINTLLLLHFDGTNGSTTFTDECNTI